MSDKLTPGAIRTIAKGDQIQNAALQVINIRRIEGAAGLHRFRLLMSDGVNTLSSFMLATQLNVLVEQKEIAANCICRIKKYIVNTLKDGRRVVIIIDLEVLKSASDVEKTIGEPTPYVEGEAKTTSPTSNPPAKSFKQQSSYNSEMSMNRGAPKDVGKQKAFPDPPNTPGGSQSKVVPIASLNPYQSKWTIRARITNKSQIRTWSNSRGEGKLFSMEIVDESGEIRVTGFNEQVDKYYAVIEVNKVYYISKGTLKIANKQYTNVKNDYEMTLNNDTSIVPCDDAGDVPMLQFEFVPIEELENKEKDSVVDVIGICKSYDEVTKITTKASKEVSKRAVHLMDMSGKVITTTLWGEEAEKFDGSGQPVLAIKGARLSDFGGRSLSVLFSSTLMMNPDIPEAFKLRGWFDSEGHAVEGSSMSEMKGSGGGNATWKTLSEVKTENLGHGDKADYFTCVATIVYLRKENCMYQACPTQDCNKKVVDQQNGLFRCEKCDKEFPNFKYRMILSANIADFSDNQWVTCFQESAEAMLGKSGDYLGELRDSNEQAFDEVFQNANFRTYTFRNRVKLESYNDESRIKASVMDVKPVDHKEYSKRLLMNIRKYATQ
ncbi:replication protein A 70 kDa DNA-binding subunit-like [Acipenser oxyrinchus oxyrinchus]|uniref:Replication protein A subunit n=1 Tax=Acipenser oxyrinchus oxyrinchus TaxID=40147 RepID=A0AAD8FU91_ACIOX|nr:replication protein A 70 kDa DNA-binding subunit-like [Acipenser oxyrinchus oxyrinchus]